MRVHAATFFVYPCEVFTSDDVCCSVLISESVLGRTWAGPLVKVLVACDSSKSELLEKDEWNLTLDEEFYWSGRRESNPRSQLGKLMFCR